MKTIQYLFFAAVATLLMAADCSNKDSEFYNDVYVAAPNLVSINRSLIPEDQTVFISATIPKLLPVTGIANPLDIFKTTGGATKLDFSYELEKQNTDGTWDYFEITAANTLTTAGSSQINSYVLASLILNATTNNYEYASGLKALPAGNYRLSFGYNSASTYLVEFRSQSFDNNLFINIDSAISALNGEGYYTFTIN